MSLVSSIFTTDYYRSEPIYDQDAHLGIYRCWLYDLRLVTNSVQDNTFGTNQNIPSNTSQGDGNGQFRAISETLYGVGDFYKDVRADIVKWLRENPNYFVDLDETCQVKDFVVGPYEEYLKELARDGTPGDQLTIYAASECFTVHIFLEWLCLLVKH